LPVGKSSGSVAWPILCHVVNIKRSRPFAVGIYYGPSKPDDYNDLLKEFADEMLILLRKGFEYGDKVIKIKIRAIICDAPARAAIKYCKGHSGYCACERCEQHGQDYKQRVVFFNKSGKLRTHESFVAKSQTQHHHELNTSILLDLPGLDIVRDFPLEYMHLGLLGNMKKILVFLISMRSNIAALAPALIRKISSDMESFDEYTPSEFSRRPRSFSDLSRFKCTELRCILFYFSPLLFKQVMSRELFEHYMHFQIAFTLLGREDLYRDNMDTAQELLEHFVETYGDHYGDESISYCVHSLLHVVDDVRRFGKLDDYSGFKFENELQVVRNSIKGFSKPLQQMIRRQNEKIGLELLVVPPSYPILCRKYIGGPLPETISSKECVQYQTVIFNNFRVNLTNKNNKIMTDDGKLVDVVNIIEYDGNRYLVGTSYLSLTDFYCINSIRSSQLGIFKVDTRETSLLNLFPFSSIKSKFMVIPYDNNLAYAVPLIHTHHQ